MQSYKKLMIVAAALAVAGVTSAVTPFPGARPSAPAAGTRIDGDAALLSAASVKEAPMRLGENNPLSPPFCETFDNFRSGMEYDDFPRYFQVLDFDGDGRSWGLYNYVGERPYGRCAYMLYPMDGAQADDWLITRAIRLEQGKYYCVSVYAGLYQDETGEQPQVFEVKIGSYNDAAGLQTTVIPRTEVFSKTMSRVQGWFTPPATGKYYIGVHGISPYYDGYYNYLFMDNIAVDSPKEGSVPGEVTDVVMTNDSDGSTAVDIAFTAPLVTLDGSALSALSSIVVKRGDVTVGSVPAPVVPGKRYHITDTPAEEGYYEYSITASNESGEGAVFNCGHTAGIAAPMPPVISSIEELENGEVRLVWAAVTEDVNGNVINPAKVTYDVLDVSDVGESVTLASGMSATELTFAPHVGSGQKLAVCAVVAKINGKESAPAVSDNLPVGIPYPLPYHNSFTMADYYEYVLSMDNTSDNLQWILLDDHSDPRAQDDDNGYICLVGTMPGQSSWLYSGKIDLRDADSPILTFYTYRYTGDENEINVSVTDMSTHKRAVIANIRLADYSGAGWQRVIVPLSRFAGKVVSVGLEGVIVSHGYLPVDNMTVEEQPAVDLVAGNVEYPRRAEADEVFEIKATVFNNGTERISDYTVTLLAGNREVDVAAGVPVKSLGEVQVSLHDSFTATSQASTAYRIRIDVDGDSKPDNNNSEPFSIVFLAPNHPRVLDLSGSEEDGIVTLTWSAPDLSTAAPEEVTEDFEKYDAFANALDGWTMIDADGGYMLGFQDIRTPVDNTRQAFWVMSKEGDFSFIPTHSGRNVLVAMYAVDSDGHSIPNDDWLVSPELYGGVQNIDFYGATLTENYGRERFEVYYSTEGNDRGDFELLVDETEAPEEWTDFFVALPEGTKYFAIRYVSDDRYMFLLDDITYIPAGEPRHLELIGYNVYRNGVRINEQPVTGTTYTSAFDSENDTYFVTVVYDRGESVGSNVVGFGAGVAEIYADGAPVEMFDLRGIRVDPKSVAPGIYICRRGAKVEKVLVK